MLDSDIDNNNIPMHPALPPTIVTMGFEGSEFETKTNDLSPSTDIKNANSMKNTPHGTNKIGETFFNRIIGFLSIYPTNTNIKAVRTENNLNGKKLIPLQIYPTANKPMESIPKIHRLSLLNFTVSQQMHLTIISASKNHAGPIEALDSKGPPPIKTLPIFLVISNKDKFTDRLI